MVWPSKVRRGRYQHAFEEALDEASLDADGNPILFDDDAERVTGPMVGSLGDIPIASRAMWRSLHSRGPTKPKARMRPIPNCQVSLRWRRKRGAAPAVALKQVLESKTHTSAELRKLRRRFAAANHPDRVDAALRDEASPRWPISTPRSIERCSRN